MIIDYADVAIEIFKVLFEETNSKYREKDYFLYFLVI